MKKHVLIGLLICLSNLILAQDIEVESNNLISDRAFDKLSFSDLNFLVIGDETPKQGVEFEFKEKKTSLKVSGLLKSYNRSFITVDGEFTVDDGVYFFDENNGSKQSKFTLNYFYTIDSWRNYNRIESDGKDTSKEQRAYVNAKLTSIDMVIKAFNKYETLRVKMEALKLPYDPDYLEKQVDSFTTELGFNFEPKAIAVKKDKVKEGIKELKKDLKDVKVNLYEIRREIRDTKKDTTFIGVYEEFEQEEDEAIRSKPFKFKINDDGKEIVSYDIGDIAVTQKLLTEFESAIRTIDSLREKIYKKEIDIASEVWNSKTMFYGGVSGFYQRENITIYNFIENQSFGDLFSDTIGDVYGITASLNGFTQWNTNWWLGPDKDKKHGKKDISMIYARIKGSLGRGSNISSFTKSKIALESPTGDVINENPITILNSKDGYIGPNEYSYGIKTGLDAEAYAFLFEGIGLFGRIGYSSLNFDDDKAAKSNEKYPMRLGLLFNLKGKDKTKDVLAFQVFLDRTDLKLDPNGKDKDLRFGFSVGLPINLKSKL